jgi:ribonuclease P protein component
VTGSAQPAPATPRRATIRKRAEFVRIQGTGERVNTERFVLILARQDLAGDPRLGITASRRIGNAIVRNRAKRLVREAFRATRDLHSRGIDLVVIVRKPLTGARLDDVVEEWRRVAAPIKKRSERLLRLAPGASGAKNGTRPPG